MDFFRSFYTYSRNKSHKDFINYEKKKLESYALIVKKFNYHDSESRPFALKGASRLTRSLAGREKIFLESLQEEDFDKIEQEELKKEF